jgi:Heparinase II/III-like protein/Heparinase II/III N-terminus
MTILSLTTPRPVFCVIDAEHRSLEAAAAAADGRFAIQGTTLALGVEPDWVHAPLPADREWRLEWSKFYFGLDLAWGYWRTRDARFVRAWERLADSWIAQVPAGFDTSDVIGRRVQNWIYAWDRFSRVPGPGVSDNVAARVLGSLREQLAHLRANLSAERNHRTLELYALFIGALALPALDPDGSLRAFAIAELSRNLCDDVLPDGVHREASTHYHLLVLRSFLGVLENARRFGLVLPPTFRPRLARACEFAVHCHRPDGQIPALSDSDTGSYRRLLRLAARLFRRRDWLYVATAGRQGTPPERTAASFERGGYFVQRSGWGAGATPFAAERYLMFDCGPLGDGGHGHYDMLNVEIAAGGHPLIVDPGRFTYHADESDGAWRRWFKGTAAHNTVTVDGLDQVAYRPGRPKGPLPRARFGGRSTHPGLDVMWGEVASPCYDAVHRRRILFVAGQYWIIEDSLTASQPHRYDLRFHLSPDASADAHVYGGPHPVAVGSGVALVFGAAHDVALEHGWVSPSYGIKHSAAVVVATERGRQNARFITLVAPRTRSAPLPRLRVQTGDDASVAVVVVEGVTIGVRDLIAWTPDGRAAVTRTHRDGSTSTWCAPAAESQPRFEAAPSLLEMGA